MRFPWQVQAYDRTCTECGYTWRVPKSAARQRLRSIYLGTDGLNLARAMQSRSAAHQVAGDFQRCFKCSADHFTQHAARCPENQDWSLVVRCQDGLNCAPVSSISAGQRWGEQVADVRVDLY
jgi:hypothetical protein